MSLRDYLIENDLSAAAPADVVAGLDATVEISRNERLQNLRAVMNVLQNGEFEIAAATIKTAMDESPALAIYWDAIKGDGINWSSPKAATMIRMLAVAGNWPETLTAKLLALGIVEGPGWKKAGLDALPSEADVAAAQETIASEALREAVAARYQAVRAAVDAGEILTWDAARTAMGAE